MLAIFIDQSKIEEHPRNRSIYYNGRISQLSCDKILIPAWQPTIVRLGLIRTIEIVSHHIIDDKASTKLSLICDVSFCYSKYLTSINQHDKRPCQTEIFISFIWRPIVRRVEQLFVVVANLRIESWWNLRITTLSLLKRKLKPLNSLQRYVRLVSLKKHFPFAKGTHSNSCASWICPTLCNEFSINH